MASDGESDATSAMTPRCRFHVGIDLGCSARSKKASSAVAVLDDAGSLIETPRLFRRVDELVSIMERFPREETIVAIDAPRSVPDHRAEDYARRSCESQLAKASGEHVGSFAGVAALFVRWMEIERKHFDGWQIIEVYPRTIWHRLGLPGKPKDLVTNSVAVCEAIRAVAALDCSGFLSHQVDATLAAFTALCYGRGQVQLYGNEGEGRLIVPDLTKEAGLPMAFEPISESFRCFPSQAGRGAQT